MVAELPECWQPENRQSGTNEPAPWPAQQFIGSLQMTFQEKPHLPQFADMIHVGLRRDMHAQRAVIVDQLQLRDQPAVFDLALADADLQLVLGSIAQPRVNN